MPGIALNKRLSAWLLALLAWVAISGAVAQESGGVASAGTESTVAFSDEASAQALRKLQAIKQALEAKRERVRELITQLESADEVDRDKLQAQIAEQRDIIATLIQSFENVAVDGASLRELEQQPQQKLNWHDELMQIAQPLLNSLKEATEKPRRIEELRRDIDLYQQQYEITRRAVRALSQYERMEIPGPVAEGLAELEANWRERGNDIARALEHARDDLRVLESEEIDVLETVTEVAEEFFLGRGLTLLIALLVALGLWYAMRGLRYLATLRRQPREDSERAARLRLVLYGYHLLTLLLVSLGVLSVFYVRGDLLLLSLSIIALVMLTLGAWRYLPRYLQEGRLLLNVGAAREGERVTWAGLPFRITSLNLYTELRNPELDGVIRLPLSALSQLISRPRGQESWFPTRVGDYLLLADGSFAQVLQQGIEWVRLKVMGSVVQVPSAEFLQQPVRNLSREGFGIAVTFGIDYRHQPVALEQVPERLRDSIASAFDGAGFGADLKDLQVEFKQAGVNSLDYLVYASMDGNAAASYFAIGRLIQKACVAACNREGWDIPFTQVTLHQAQTDAQAPA